MSSKVSWDYLIKKLNLLFDFYFEPSEYETLSKIDIATILICAEPFFKERYNDDTKQFNNHFALFRKLKLDPFLKLGYIYSLQVKDLSMAIGNSIEKYFSVGNGSGGVSLLDVCGHIYQDFENILPFDQLKARAGLFLKRFKIGSLVHENGKVEDIFNLKKKFKLVRLNNGAPFTTIPPLVTNAVTSLSNNNGALFTTTPSFVAGAVPSLSNNNGPPFANPPSCCRYNSFKYN
jgi:hypothetical protein